MVLATLPQSWFKPQGKMHTKINTKEEGYTRGSLVTHILMDSCLTPPSNSWILLEREQNECIRALLLLQKFSVVHPQVLSFHAVAKFFKPRQEGSESAER